MTSARFPRWALGVAVGVPGVYAAWIAVGFGGTRTTLIASDAGTTLTSAAAAAACLWAARTSASGRERWGWALLGAGCGAWALGEAVWSWYEVVLGIEVPFPSWADIGYLAMIPLAVAGVLALSPLRRAALARQLVDALIIGGALFFVSWALVLREVAQEAVTGGVMAQAVSIAYPLGDVVIMAVVLIAATRAASGTRPDFVLVGGGMAALALADSGFLYLVDKGLYASGHPIDNAWVVAFVLVAAGAVRHARRPVGEDRQSEPRAPGGLAASLPSLIVAVGLGVVARERLAHGGIGPVLFWSVVSVVGLVLVRDAAVRMELGGLTRHLERKVHERTRELARRERRFRALVANSSDVVVILDDNLRVEYVGDSAAAILGYDVDDVVGDALVTRVHPEDRPRLLELLRGIRRRPGAVATVDYRIRHRDGGWRHVETTVKNLIDEPSVRALVLNTRDITAQRTLEHELTHRAFHDSLTGLPNRALFTDRVEQAMARANRRGSDVTVLYLDLDGFKVVNDTLGHAVGDQLLEEVGQRLASTVRSADTVARFGGDEFAVLLDDGTEVDDGTRLASRILTAFESPFSVGGRDVVVSPSIGLASTSTGLESPGDLLRDADVAMYRAKADGRGRYAQFDPEMHEAVRERLELEADLRRALGRREFFLEYQPIVDLSTGQVTGTEALVRWRHPTRGVLPPAVFIPVAEDSGLIVPLGAWVIHEATRQLAVWRERLGRAAPRSVSVNVSARQFRGADLVETVGAALASNGVEPEALVLELTESLLIDDPDEAAAKLRAIKELGVTIAVDDFGIGYSSLSYLHRFPIDVLKIDRVFVQGLGGSPEDAAVAQAIVRLARTFRFRTVGEGVETHEQAEALRRMRCDAGQGFLFSRPIAPADLEVLLRVPLASAV